MNFTFDTDIFSSSMTVFCLGIGIGFTIGFIAWAIGLGVYQIIRWIRMA